MSKPYPLFLILLTIAISGCVIKGEPSSNTTSDQVQVQAQAAITATAIATSTPVIFGHENSTVYVEIKGSEFKPSELRIINGTIVKWKNMDDAQYIINGTNFVSPPLNRRENWSHTFNKTGTFEYNCPLHSWMKPGHIIVE
jgi:plastocyanin